jgi:hypothetical protein
MAGARASVACYSGIMTDQPEDKPKAALQALDELRAARKLAVARAQASRGGGGGFGSERDARAKSASKSKPALRK